MGPGEIANAEFEIRVKAEVASALSRIADALEKIASQLEDKKA